ncbi:MAG: hypothetical protein HQL39_12650 [Alphaproteobacteria bacterium]|nr:hypothetical protein [Alphaproteobacteria bacterium]
MSGEIELAERPVASATPERQPNGYNQIFDRIRIAAGDDQVIAFVAYGLYKLEKQEWARKLSERSGRPPTPGQADDFVDTWGAKRLESVLSNAANIVSAYTNAAIENERPQIAKDAIGALDRKLDEIRQGDFWKAAWSSTVGAFGYSLVIILVALVLKVSGIDVLNVLEKFRPG